MFHRVLNFFNSIQDISGNNQVYLTQDISGNNQVINCYNSQNNKKWIKLILNDNTISFQDYKRCDNFKHVSNIILDNSNKRKTLIRSEIVISKFEYNENVEYVYLFTINDKIVKIGGTRAGLKERFTSYLCGHYITERGKSGYCSRTNGIIYNTFEFYLNLGCEIKMYAYKLPEKIIEINFFDEEIIRDTTQTFHIYESKLLEEYKQLYGMYPILSFNSNPKYKL